jgi:hypothetical protein
MRTIFKIKYPITLLQNQEADQRGNYQGFPEIEILQFNFNGKGDALVRYPALDQTEPCIMYSDELEFCLTQSAHDQRNDDTVEGDAFKNYYKLDGVKKIEYN